MKKFLSKFKVLSVAGIATLGAVSANAAGLTMGSDGSVTGSLELGPMYGVATALFAALGALIVVRWAIGFVKKG